MEKFSQTSRLRDNVGVLLADQGSRFANPSHISPHDLWQEIPVISFSFLGWLGDLLDHWGTMLAALTLLLVCVKALSFASGLLARCLSAHRIWGAGSTCWPLSSPPSYSGWPSNLDYGVPGLPLTERTLRHARPSHSSPMLVDR